MLNHIEAKYIHWNPSGKARTVSLKLQNLAYFQAPFLIIMFISPLMTGHLFWKATFLGGLYGGIPLYISSNWLIIGSGNTGFVICSVLSHSLNQSWLIINWIFWTNLVWNLYLNMIFFLSTKYIQKCLMNYVVYKVSTDFPRPWCVYHGMYFTLASTC